MHKEGIRWYIGELKNVVQFKVMIQILGHCHGRYSTYTSIIRVYLRHSTTAGVKIVGGLLLYSTKNTHFEFE